MFLIMRAVHRGHGNVESRAWRVLRRSKSSDTPVPAEKFPAEHPSPFYRTLFFKHEDHATRLRCVTRL